MKKVTYIVEMKLVDAPEWFAPYEHTNLKEAKKHVNDGILNLANSNDPSRITRGAKMRIRKVTEEIIYEKENLPID